MGARERERTERLQVVLSTEELAVDESEFRIVSQQSGRPRTMRRGLLPASDDAKPH